MATYRELLAEKERLDAELEEAWRTEVAAVIETIRAQMDAYGLTVDDLSPRRGRYRGETAPLPPKYRDPRTGKTWSGRGRAPAWLGKNRDRFLISE
ncbi:H-NS family nucleoid-associated regulatory protein [Cupriavidus sp. AU9028]|uniref:H-NS histone family protein n=1 Tax=Cupriavidus sp. AU9028 TaxID=2871157 RepID=UPI001C97AB83|nr:H-NS histone family protein [Cupriavidus sp. AU9028]MBY4898715.1 H-NS histone family protein [Cupriavidus sp. AU9028]